MAISLRTFFKILGVFCCGSVSAVHAATFSTIATFPGSDDGGLAYASLAKYGNAIYSTTYQGGTYFNGTIFKTDIATGATRTVYSFTGGADGASPNGLVPVGRLLYGTTSGNTVFSYGTVFSFDPSTGKETTLYSFSGQDGQSPDGKLTQSGGYLYGTTVYGGTNGFGAVFKIDPVSGAETTLYSFSGGLDGEYPRSALQASGHFLYGTTQYGGSSANDGTVFRIDLANGKETILHSFAGNDGSDPEGALVLAGGILYGSTAYGGANGWGSVYAYTIKTGGEAVLHSFNYDADGFFPTGGLIDVGGVLYGTASGGPSPAGGTIFSIDLAAQTTTIIHNFPISTANGYNPQSALLDVDGVLYGTTGSGGLADFGTVFKFAPGSGTLTSLHDFTGVGPGQYINGSLLQVGDVFYGTTPQGGAAKLGGLFELAPTKGKIKTLYSFEGGRTGYNPQASLTLLGGQLVGTTHSATTIAEAGAIFSFNPTTNTLSTIFSFDGSSLQGASGGAAFPNSAVLDVGGTLYGTTSGLGTGTVYSFAPASGGETTLAMLPGQGYGQQPPGGGLVSLGGLLYGTSFTGGAHNYGTVFSTDPTSGNTTIVYSFQSASDGAKPAGGLIAVNGILYGTTTTSGARYNGTLFALDPSSGTLTTLHAFSAYGDGVDPSATLLNVGGVIYGTTKGGGANNAGTVFAYDPGSALFSTLYSFTGAADGGVPQAALINDNGVLYGTTSMGGAFNRGTAFSLVP